MYMLVQEEEGGRSYVSSDVNNSRNKISRYISNFPRFSFPSSTNHRREDLSHRGVESSFLRVLSSLLIGIIASYPSLSIFNSSRSNFPLDARRRRMESRRGGMFQRENPIHRETRNGESIRLLHHHRKRTRAFAEERKIDARSSIEAR